MAIALNGGSTGSTSTITASPTANRAVTVPDADFTITGNDLTQTLTNKTISSGVLTGTLTAGGNVGTLNDILISTGTGVQWSAPAAAGVATITFGTTGLTPNTASTGAVSVGGTLANTNGGTGQSSAFTQYGVTYANTTTALATTSAGTTTTVLHGNASGAPTFGAVSLTADVSGILPAGSGGTGVANNAASTLTISGAFATTLTVSATTAVTLPTTGTLATLGGTETFTNKTLTNPTVTSYVETVVAIGTVTTTNTLSLTSGTVQTATLTASTACTFTMPTATAGKSFVLLLKQAATTGNGTATFTSVKFGSAGAPTITSAAGKMDILTFISDGTNWYGSIAQGYTP
jgi:hypothetical protein